ILTGRAPIAQPPGSETSARPKRASSGPSTRIEARMVLTSSYGAKYSRIALASTSMRMRSSMVPVPAYRAVHSMVVVTSCRCGTLPIVTGPSANSAPARMGSVAFLAPEMRTSPSSAMPPVICSLSTAGGALPRARRPLLRRIGCDARRMDLASHALAKRPIDQLVARQGPQTLEVRADQPRREVRIVVRAHLDLRLRHRRLNQFCDLLWSHSGS